MKRDNKPLMLIIIAFFLILMTFGYFFAVTFMAIPDKNVQIAYLILGYVSGVVTSVVGYYYGSSWIAPKAIPSDGKVNNDDKSVEADKELVVENEKDGEDS